MTTRIQHRRSSTPGTVPTTAQVLVGELALNLADKKIYTNDGGAIVEIGGGGGSGSPDTITIVNGNTNLVAGTRYMAVVSTVSNMTLPAFSAGKLFYVSNSRDSTANIVIVVGALNSINHPAFSVGDDVVLKPGEFLELGAENSTELEILDYGVYQPTGDTTPAGSIGMTFDGGGSAVIPAAGEIVVPYNSVITEWTILADTPTTCLVEVSKCPFANFPSFTAITGAAKISLTSSQSQKSSTLTGWTTSLTAGEIVKFSVESNNNATRLVVVLTVQRM